MKLFQKKGPTREEVETLAQNLILSEFSPDHRGRLVTFGSVNPPPSTRYAQEVLREAMKDVSVVKAMNSLVGTEALKEIVNERIDSEVQKVLKEELIEEIVAKINKLQVSKGE